MIEREMQRRCVGSFEGNGNAVAICIDTSFRMNFDEIQENSLY